MIEAQETSGSDVYYDFRAFSDTVIISVKLNTKDDKTSPIENDRLLLHAARLISPMITNGIFKGVYLRGGYFNC
jgi:hypothetical protein